MSTNDTTPVSQTPKNKASAAEVCCIITMLLGLVLVVATLFVLLAVADPQTKAVPSAIKPPLLVLAIAGYFVVHFSRLTRRCATRLRRETEDLECRFAERDRQVGWAWAEVNRLKGRPVATPDAPPTPPTPKEQLVRLIEERREKREAVLLSELEPYLKEAHLEQIDEEYTPKIDALYATV